MDKLDNMIADYRALASAFYEKTRRLRLTLHDTLETCSPEDFQKYVHVAVRLGHVKEGLEDFLDTTTDFGKEDDE